ncbi:MAG: hypothetical protein ABEJ66_02110, partial [Candidatus Nanohaloarchaea archaeon]
MCFQAAGDSVSKWYDQDYSRSVCRANALYGAAGVRWFDAGYVKKHFYAVKKGIDDDWNAMFEQEWADNDLSGNYTSRPEKVDSRSDIVNKHLSPVPAGSPNKSINTLGFCGGDDGDEEIVVQRCRANACKTDTSVMGVVEANRKKSCILDLGQVPDAKPSERWKLFQPGESVKMRYGKTISCFDGV